MLKCLKRTPSQPSNVQSAAGGTTWASLISICSKGRPSGSLMPRGAPSKACYSYFATPAGTGIDVRRNILPLEQLAWQGPPALPGTVWAHSPTTSGPPNLAPKSKFGSKFGPRGQNRTPNPNLGLVWAPGGPVGPLGPGCCLI